MQRVLRPLWDYGAFWWLFAAILVGELLLNLAIVYVVPYTEIDWVAYMQEVGGVLEDGEWDYMKLEGQTGPIVYPAGFVWIYSCLYYLTGHGEDILAAQLLFVLLHVAFMAVVLLVYREAGKAMDLPPWTLILLCLSRRVHSIFVLRLFNDCWAMLLLYTAVYAYVRYAWVWGSVLISLALSVKMNILLFLPPLMVVMVKSIGMAASFGHLALMVAVQLVVGLPFLLHEPWSYLARSFNFSRKFFYVWTVNWKFLSEEQFLSDELSLALLAATGVSLVAFGLFKWCKQEGGAIAAIFGWHAKDGWPKLSPAHVACLLFTGNFIGIAFSRSLHFQFYVWYYHTLPLLLWCTPYPTPIRLALLLATEVVWNIFPSNAVSSAVLQVVNALIFLGLFFGRVPGMKEGKKDIAVKRKKKAKKQ